MLTELTCTHTNTHGHGIHARSHSLSIYQSLRASVPPIIKQNVYTFKCNSKPSPSDALWHQIHSSFQCLLCDPVSHSFAKMKPMAHSQHIQLIRPAYSHDLNSCWWVAQHTRWHCGCPTHWERERSHRQPESKKYELSDNNNRKEGEILKEDQPVSVWIWSHTCNSNCRLSRVTERPDTRGGLPRS